MACQNVLSLLIGLVVAGKALMTLPPESRISTTTSGAGVFRT